MGWQPRQRVLGRSACCADAARTNAQAFIQKWFSEKKVVHFGVRTQLNKRKIMCFSLTKILGLSGV
jgi:hypothetical protein